MGISISWLERQTACFLVMLLVAPFGEAATPLSPVVLGTAVAIEGQAGPQSDGPRASETVAAASQSAPSPNDADTTGVQAAAQNQQPAASQISPANQQSTTPAPVGTAAAPYVKPEGVPASSPAGAAIAPAKQRRIRSFTIRIGLLVGAGIAIGTVAAASLGSRGRPH